MERAFDVKNLTRAETRAALVALGEPAFRGDQVYRWVHGRDVDDPAAMTDLSRALRERLVGLDPGFTSSRLDLDAEQVSTDGTRKLRLRTGDGRFIESVLIPDGDAGSDTGNDEDDDEERDSIYDGGRRDEPSQAGALPRRPRLTQCISSQVGCALDCRFCATATLGFGRNLTAGEIVDQYYRARALLAALPPDDPTRRAGAERVTNLVFMGMGEPLHNLTEVLRALSMLTDQMGAALSPRRITVSTAGLVPAIAKLGESPVRVNLAVSLNATTDAVRDEIMPINRKWNLAALLGALRRFPLERRRRIIFEYVLLAGVNDSLDDARRLPGLLRGIPAKVNLIPWNPHPLAPYRRPADEVVAAFHRELRAHGLAVYVRRSRGRDIDAACGQLVAQKEPPGDEGLVALRSR